MLNKQTNKQNEKTLCKIFVLHKKKQDNFFPEKKHGHHYSISILRGNDDDDDDDRFPIYLMCLFQKKEETFNSEFCCIFFRFVVGCWPGIDTENNPI